MVCSANEAADLFIINHASYTVDVQFSASGTDVLAGKRLHGVLTMEQDGVSVVVLVAMSFCEVPALDPLWLSAGSRCGCSRFPASHSVAACLLAQSQAS
jgi:hypothetical protein